MSQSLLNKFNLSRERLSELQNELLHKGQDVRDASLTTLYGVGATTLSRAAEWADKVPLVRGSAQGLRERAEAAQEAGEAVQRPPIAEYDELNVKQVAEALDGLSAYDLQKVQRYEQAHKDRVTVLREIDRRLD